MHIRSGGCLHPNAAAQSASSGPTARRRTTDARKALGYPDSKQRQVTRRPVLADRGEQAIGHRVPALLTSEVFVPVDIVRGAADEDDVEPAVSVEVAYADLVSFLQLAKDHPALPCARFAFRVDDHLVAVPRFDSSHVTLLVQVPDGNVAGPGARRFLLVTLGELPVLPADT